MTLVESIARAITRAKGEDPDSIVRRFKPETGYWMNAGPLWHDNLDLAQAALSAIEAAGVKLCEGEPVGWSCEWQPTMADRIAWKHDLSFAKPRASDIGRRHRNVQPLYRAMLAASPQAEDKGE